ncbi:MAG: right-handed parallel beta-helix repeat-containing protein [bacterium]|nr:right-handed parallel beta-helix repeat-containing protein [bacterium]
MKFLFSVFSGLLILVSVAFAGEGVIDIAYSPYTISQSGSYIVVKDLTTPIDTNCITINASNVTIDLNGHTLYGAGTAVGASGKGIVAGSAQHNITVTNGVIRDFRTRGIELFGKNCQVSKVKAVSNRTAGIYISGDGGIVSGSVAEGNHSTGISVGDGSVVTGNVAVNNGWSGISAPYGCTVTGNSGYNNGGDGIAVLGNCVVTNNSVARNARYGIFAMDGCTVTGNSINNNGQNGIYLSSKNYIAGNTIADNTSATYGRGLWVDSTRNRIDSNHIVNNRIGIQFNFATNWYGRNTFSGNAAGNTTGDVPVDPAAAYVNQSF